MMTFLAGIGLLACIAGVVLLIKVVSVVMDLG